MRALALVLLLAALVATALPVRADSTVFGDGFGSGWQDWSWSPNPATTTSGTTHTGSLALAFTPDNYNAVSGWCSSCFSSSVTALELWLHGGATGGQQVEIAVLQGTDQVVVAQPVSALVAGGWLPANQWTKVTLPLNGLGSSSLTRFWVRATAGNTQGTLYIDDIVLVQGGSTPTTTTTTTTTTTGGGTSPDPYEVPAPLPAGSACGSKLGTRSRNGRLEALGQQLLLKGANWFGFESDNAPHGLWTTTMQKILDWAQANQINALRVPLNLEMVLQNRGVAANIVSADASLAGLSGLQVLDRLVDMCAARGILVLFDLHYLWQGGGIDELWYNAASVPESQVQLFWTTLAARYAAAWNVLGADLKNEPWGASWVGDGSARDWATGAARVGNAVVAAHPDWLVFVEGVCNDAVGQVHSVHYWGGNLEAAVAVPVALSDPERLVYAPHVYGPSVSWMSYFTDTTNYANMPAIWDVDFGRLPALTSRATVLGEWGGDITRTDDANWQRALVAYLRSRSLQSSFVWAINPNSGDTKGLLQDDWATSVTAKLDLMAQLVPFPTQFSKSANGQVCISNNAAAFSSVKAVGAEDDRAANKYHRPAGSALNDGAIAAISVSAVVVLLLASALVAAALALAFVGIRYARRTRRLVVKSELEAALLAE